MCFPPWLRKPKKPMVNRVKTKEIRGNSFFHSLLNLILYVTAPAVGLFTFFLAGEELGASVMIKLEIIYSACFRNTFLPTAIILVRKQKMERTTFNFWVEIAGATTIIVHYCHCQWQR